MTQTILITGAAKRIGKAMALHFAAKGWHVAAHYSASEKEAFELKAEIEAEGGKISLFQADLMQINVASLLFENVVKTCGMPDVLINNACRFERDEGVITQESFESHMAINAHVPIQLAQQMQEGRFVFNMLDHTLDWSWPHLSSYVLSKNALEEWTKRSTRLLKPHLHIFGLRLGPTLRNPRESEAHFIEAVGKSKQKKQTLVTDILATLDLCLQNPEKQPVFFDL